MFLCFPFGLSTACFCFTKPLRPLLHRWRLLNFSCFWYLDDRISGHPDIVSASAASLIHQKDLDKSGLKVNLDKSNWHPRRIGEWLQIQMVFQVPRAKIDKLKADVLRHQQQTFLGFHFYYFQSLSPHVLLEAVMCESIPAPSIPRANLGLLLQDESGGRTFSS